MYNLLLNEGSGAGSSIIMLVVLGVLIILMLVLPTINQNKRVKAYQEMQSNLKAGDKVQTVGGIIGRIVRINEKDGMKTFVLETGDKSNKMYIEFNLDAIAGVVTGEQVATAKSGSLEAEVVEDLNKEESIEEPTVVDVDFENNSDDLNKEEKEPAKKNTNKKKK
ncbi:MAG: preprotein translocase subunit YajC [Clostridia bacterium]|nr:preprotein translocase subunit YajC [Clostridia bacterium]